MPQPQLDDLPDHLLTDILTLACEPLRASAVLPAEDALRVWGNYSSVSQRWRQLMREQGVGMVVEWRWRSLLQWLPRAPVLVQALHLGWIYGEGRDQAPALLASLLGDSQFRRRCSGCLRSITSASDSSAWLVPSDLDLGLWTALEHLPEIRLVTPEDIQRLRGLPSGLKFLGLNCKWRVEGDLVLSLPHLGRVLAHLTSLRALQINGMHVAPAQLPESVQQVSLDFCTLDPAESWPSDMRVVWEAPMSSMAPRRTLLMGRRNAAGAISSEVSWEAAVD